MAWFPHVSGMDVSLKRYHGRSRSGPMQRTVVIFSEDESLLRMIAKGLGGECVVELAESLKDPRQLLAKPGIRIVVLDDESTKETHGAWLLDQARRWAPDALVAYIAANHSPELERKVRATGAQFYAAKPIDCERTMRVLRSFAGVGSVLP